MRRGCRRLSATSLIAVAAIALTQHGASAQTAPAASTLLRPAFDADPTNPPRFSSPMSGAGVVHSGFTPVRKSTSPRKASRSGAVPLFGSPPGFGAGTTGFVSTNAVRRETKNRSGPSAGAIAPPPPSDVHPVSAAARPGAIASPPASSGFASPPRRRPPAEQETFEPMGVRAGTILLRPAIELTGGYDTRPSRAATGGGSSLAIVAPELSVRSDWQRHALGADIRGTYTAYQRDYTPSLNRPFLESKIAGRIDVSRDSRIDLENRFRLATDNPGSPNLQAGLSRLPINTAVGGSAGLAQQFNRFEVALKGSVDRTTYQDSILTDGSKASNADRNFNQYGAALRGSYEMTPGMRPFVEVGRDIRVHDLAVDRNGAQRDSDGTTVRAGTTYELTRLLVGEVSAGYLVRSYRDPALQDLRGVIYDASLVWSATPLTTATLTARSTAEETTLAGVSGTLRRNFALQIDHAFRRWLAATFKFGYGTDVYVGSIRADDRYTASAALTYKLTREAQLKGEFRRDWLTSTVPGVDYTANIFFLGLRLQR